MRLVPSLERLVRGLPKPSQRRRTSRGQSVVELALIAPVLIVLMLMALDFGRLFLGWVSLQNMARVGANYAALHPGAWGTPGNTGEVDTYRSLIASNADVINCELDPPVPADPAFPAGTEVGSPASVGLDCEFRLVTPIISIVLGDTVTMTASSTFPISFGCLADCEGGVAGPPPAPPNNCRAVPAMVGLSVSGARAAWVAAGFLPENFDPETGEATRTVADQDLSVPAGADPCSSGSSFFGSRVVVDLEPLVTPKPTPTCLYVPNMRGMTVGEARAEWTAAGFTGAFVPPDKNSQVVVEQTTDPGSAPGDCIEPPASVAVTYEPPPPPPPPAPCEVPNFANTPSQAAVATWTDAGFDGSNLTFDRPNKLPYEIKSQTLVGLTFASCDADILLSDKAKPGQP